MQEKERNTVVVRFDPANPPLLTDKQKSELSTLAQMPDSEIDYSDIPPVADFSGFHRARHHCASVRIDNDILEWIKTLGDDREKLVNKLLRHQMNLAIANNG